MKGKPTGQNIRIEIINSGFTSMEMVDEKENRTEKATVLEIGDEVTKVNVGDTILFKAYEVDEILLDDEKFVIITEESIKYIWKGSGYNTFTELCKILDKSYKAKTNCYYATKEQLEDYKEWLQPQERILLDDSLCYKAKKILCTSTNTN